MQIKNTNKNYRTMTQDEITALSHEYGEYAADSLGYDMYSDPDFKKKMVAKGNARDAQLVLEWLSQRYCLVEKSMIKDMYEAAKKQPLAERLTEEEKEKVKAFYNGDTFGELAFIEIISCRKVFENLFGKELFEKE